MWTTKPMGRKRANLSAYATDWNDRRDETKSKPKLDGTGTCGDFGANEAAATPPSDDKSEENGNAYVEGSPVPRTIAGMNQVLQQRARAASAESAVAYAKASSSTAVKDVHAATGAISAAIPSPHHKFIPPHKRKLLAGHTKTPSVSPAPEPAKLFQAQNSKATPVQAPPAVQDPECVFALIQARLENQQKEKAALSRIPTTDTTKVVPAAQNKNDHETAVINGLYRYAPGLPAKVANGRPPPGPHFGVPTNSDRRRASSTTLVNDVNYDDEALARMLQAEDFGLTHAVHTENMINQALEHFKFVKDNRSTPVVRAKNLDPYQKLHKVQETVWKQESMKLQEFAKTKDSLYQMSDTELQCYYEKVVSAHLAQWNSRRNRIEQITTMQSDLAAKNPYTVDDLIAMDTFSFRVFFNKISATHKHNSSALDMSSESDRQSIIMQDDVIEEDAGEQDFDSDGFGISGGEDDDDDDDDEVIFFKGHRG
ncbi:hypothetical protein PMIN03_010512 [Paraphaeosphaeria minitans]